jgi:hypothetical protein
MDIHKPKPWHGVREFLKEYIIIVVGVLTALAAEQGVEWLHWRERAAEGRARLVAEIGHHYLVAEERLRVQSCLDRQLTKIEDRVLASGSNLAPLPLFGSTSIFPEVYRVPARSLTASAWQSVISESLSSHLTEKERGLLPIHYSQFDKFRELTAEEDVAAGSLMALSKPLPMDAQIKTNFVSIIEHERFRNRQMGILARQMTRRIDNLGYTPTSTSRSQWLQASITLKDCVGLQVR